MLAQQIPPHLRDLNPEQLRAVQHKDGPLLIFAGAGSGKTRVLTRRIANLIYEHNVHPLEILAVTFTNKAAREMKERVSTLFQGRNIPTWVSTFHATCGRILRENAKYLGFSQNFAIYDSSDSLSTLKRVYKNLKIDPKSVDPKTVRHTIDRAKNNYLFPEDIKDNSLVSPAHTELVAHLFENYQRELQSSNAMDFGDLLCNVVTLFKLEKEVLQKYHSQFNYLLIDEYQDTNKVQYMLVKMLTNASQNLCVVGDDDQSVYAFRGATIQNILNFKKDFSDAEVVTLDTNYRSTQNILTVANAIISKNKNRTPKTMKTPNPKGDLVKGICASDERNEAQTVIQEILSLKKKGVSLSEIAIFYRTNAQSRVFEEELSMNGVPYEMYGGFRFYERKEIKDIVSYLRFILNHNDNESFLRIINTPARGLGPTAVGTITALANEKNCSLYSGVLAALAEPKMLKGAVKEKFSNFVSLIDELSEYAKITEHELANEDASYESRIESIAKLLQLIATRSGYLADLKQKEFDEYESRLENIHELFNVAVDFVKRRLDQGEAVLMQDFLQSVSLASDTDEENKKSSDENGEKVSMMTLHLAKGLEFDYVFFVGFEEGLVPHMRSIESGIKEDIEEERRLCYVGITRAKKKLYLLRAEIRLSYGRNSWFSGLPSRFSRDLDVSAIENCCGFIE